MDSFFISFLPQRTPKENKTIQAIVILGQGLLAVLQSGKLTNPSPEKHKSGFHLENKDQFDNDYPPLGNET